MDGAGRVLLRDMRRAGEYRPLVANLLKAIVDDFVALTSMMPDTKVPKPGTDPSDQEFADMVEKYHYGVQHASRFKLHLKAMSWFNHTLGSCAGVVWPDFRTRHMKMRIVGPDKVYGATDLLDPFSFSSCVLIESYSPRTIRDYFPGEQLRTFIEQQSTKRAAWWGEGDRVEIVRWFDQDEIVTVLGRQKKDIKKREGELDKIEYMVEMGRVRHHLGQCPIVPFQNFLIPGELRSLSDIEEAVGMNQFINFLFNAHEEGIKQELFAPLVLIDPDKAPEDIDTSNPMEIIPIRKGGDAKRLQGGNSAQQVMGAEISRAQQIIEYVTGSTAVRTQGKQPSSSIATGRSLEKAQAPQMTRIEYKTDLNAESITKMNEISVIGTTTIFGDEQVDLFGTHGRTKSLFKMRIMGKDLQGYTFNLVTYPPSLYMGLEQRIVAMEQLLGGKYQMASVRTAMEYIGLVDHPDEELAQIELDQMKLVELQNQMQQEMQPQGQGGQDALGKAVSLSAGSTKPATLKLPSGQPKGAPQPPAAAPGAPAAPGGPAAGPALPTSAPPSPGEPAPLPTDPTDQVASVVRSVHLKGKAFVSQRPDGRTEVTVQTQPDVLKLRRKLGPIFGDTVLVRSSKHVPAGAKEVGGGAQA